MSQFLGFVIFFMIAAGLVLHADIVLPRYLNWIGTLPGDIIIKKGGVTIYAPLTSSVLISIALSLIFSVFSSDKR